MNQTKKTVVVDIRLKTDLGSWSGVVGPLIQALRLTEAMQRLQLAGELGPRLENEIFNQIISLLRSAAREMPDIEKQNYLRQVENISRGIYDLCSLTARGDGEEPINLIIGKIFSYEKKGHRLYAGAAGLSNNSYNGLIREYDNEFERCLRDSPFRSLMDRTPGSSEFPDMKCMDVFALAGELNQRHKPICVFFSGTAGVNTSALKKAIVFINLYIRRFQNITMAIAKRLLDGHSLIENLEYNDIGKLLLIWLRGHDLGHFCGEDNLEKVMNQHDSEYLVLHELKSDFISLYVMRYLSNSLLEGDGLLSAYLVSVAEMLRYIRRERFYNYPDSVSALLTYLYLSESGSIVFNAKAGKFEIDKEKLDKHIEEMTLTLLDLFSEGDAPGARQFLKRWGDPAEVREKKLRNELGPLEADDIPHFVDINFVW